MSPSERQVPARPADGRVQELRASAHLMTLETGTFCLVNGSPRPADGVIFGVRVSATDPFDPNVAIAALRPDGWLAGDGDSALIRVGRGPAQILITIYQPAGATDGAPKLRVLRLSDAAPPAEAVPASAPEAVAPLAAGAARRPVMVLTEAHDIIAHVQRAGDVGHAFGDWIGTPGSKAAIEGFSITAPDDLAPGDLSYQAVLGRGWMSPWSESGQFCGSRGMALPILGFRIKLTEAAAKRYDLRLSATFVDGTRLEDVGSDESCETPALAALEAMRIELAPKGATAAKTSAPLAAPPKAGTKADASRPSPAAAPVKPAAKGAKSSKAATR